MAVRVLLRQLCGCVSKGHSSLSLPLPLLLLPPCLLLLALLLTLVLARLVPTALAAAVCPKFVHKYKEVPATELAVLAVLVVLALAAVSSSLLASIQMRGSSRILLEMRYWQIC